MNVLDLANPVVQAELDTSLQELTGDWVVQQELYLQRKSALPPTQLLGKAACDSGVIVGLKYPSAKNVGQGINYLVFVERLPQSPPSYLEVVDPNNKLRQRLP